MDDAESGRWLHALTSSSAGDSNDAARALGKAAVVSAIPALAAALCADAGGELTDAACVKAEAIAAIGGDAAIAALVDLLARYADGENDDGDETWRVHHACVRGLVGIGPPAVPALRVLLAHSNERAVRSATEALEALGEVVGAR